MARLYEYAKEGARLAVKQAAAAILLDLSVHTLAEWRKVGFGPRWFRLRGNDIRYDLRDIDAFIEANKNSSITEERAKGRRYCGAAEEGGFK